MILLGARLSSKYCRFTRGLKDLPFQRFRKAHATPDGDTEKLLIHHVYNLDICIVESGIDTESTYPSYMPTNKAWREYTGPTSSGFQSIPWHFLTLARSSSGFRESVANA